MSVWVLLSLGADSVREHPQLPAVHHVSKPAAPRDTTDPLGISTWHAAGFRGQGVKVAILDTGFQGYRKALGTALPDHIRVKSFRRDGNLEARDSQHGILCGEVIHRLAPDAELLFVNWEPDDPMQFLQAVRWARAEGARVLSCSIIMPSWSDGEGGGATHETLRRLLIDGGPRGDALFFACAGNTALRHWGGIFHAGKDGYHEWTPGHIDNTIRPLAKDRVSVELSALAGVGYEVVVRDAVTSREVGRAASQACDSSGCVAVRFDPVVGHQYTMKVRLTDAGKKQPPHFHLTVLGGRLQYAVRAGSVPFPGDGPETTAVGAVDRSGSRMTYSSCGPNSAAPKPDLVASVPFLSAWRSEQPFAGTSAAAPQGAALAALLLSRAPHWSAARVRETLIESAQRTGKGHSSEKGFGILHLP
jgi:subtilisin family serine protease